MWKSVGSVLAGVFFGSLTNMAIILVNTYVLFPPEGSLDLSNHEHMARYVASMPLPGLLIVIVAHLAQAFVGGGVAASVDEDPVRAAMIVGALSCAGGVLNLVNLSAPFWMAAELPLYFVAARAAAGVVVSRRASE